MRDAKAAARIRRKYRVVAPELDERRRRPWAAAEARDVGWGGVSLVARATGLSRPTIIAGLRELQLPAPQRAAAKLTDVPRSRAPVLVKEPRGAAAPASASV